VSKTYQTSRAEASAAADAVVPDTAMIALGEIAESAKEGLLALAVGAGLQVMAAMMAGRTVIRIPDDRRTESTVDSSDL
jgi:putative transposase